MALTTSYQQIIISRPVDSQAGATVDQQVLRQQISKTNKDSGTVTGDWQGSVLCVHSLVAPAEAGAGEFDASKKRKRRKKKEDRGKKMEEGGLQKDERRKNTKKKKRKKKKSRRRAGRREEEEEAEREEEEETKRDGQVQEFHHSPKDADGLEICQWATLLLSFCGCVGKSRNS